MFSLRKELCEFGCIKSGQYIMACGGMSEGPHMYEYHAVDTVYMLDTMRDVWLESQITLSPAVCNCQVETLRFPHKVLDRLQ